ncbi:MAG: outer membrane protein assembly factor BamE [Gammaproteobacteria bacterium]|nr:outer membrane protein assembly factor BamE [Gammaproteobacteria bacterium]
MKKLLIIITCFASLSSVACSPRFHVVHKIDIQQGNVVTQEMMDQLRPGMSRAQVQFVMGSPMVVDTFHQERWDYIYRFKPGYGDIQQDHVILYFEDDKLTRTSGSIPPTEGGDRTKGNRQTTVVVPPYERVEPGLLNRFWHWITFRKPEQP